MKIILSENDKTLTFGHFTKKQGLRDAHDTINQDVLLKIMMANLTVFTVTYQNGSAN